MVAKDYYKKEDFVQRVGSYVGTVKGYRQRAYRQPVANFGECMLVYSQHFFRLYATGKSHSLMQCDAWVGCPVSRQVLLEHPPHRSSEHKAAQVAFFSLSCLQL